MLFSLINILVSFQELINNIIREYLNVFTLIYLDNILIFSTTYKEHVQHV